MRLVNPIATIEPDRLRPAPRLRSLSGIRLGLLHNTKMNGDTLLWLIADELKSRFRIDEVHLVTKYPPQKPATKELLEDLAARSDGVVNAIGD